MPKQRGRRLLFAAMIAFAALFCAALLYFVRTGDNKRETRWGIALTDLTLIDGVGDEPIGDAVVVIEGDTIVAAGPAASAVIPPYCVRISLGGATLLPGFIDTHVHRAYDKEKLRAWAHAGVTTVRDLSNLSLVSDRDCVAKRDAWSADTTCARLLVAGPMLTVPGGYGNRYLATVEETVRAVETLADLRVNVVKVSLEDGNAVKDSLPTMSDAQLTAVMETAHRRGLRVAGHTTRSARMAKMISLGADQIAHLPVDRMGDDLIAEAVARRIPVMPTFSVYRGFVVRFDILMANLRRLYKAGGVIAFGDDYAGGPGPFELGMPMFELEKMAASGMTRMDIIRSCTSVAAAACGIGDLVGAVQAGKKADLLAVRASPLQDLSALLDVRLVMRDGVVINWGE